MRIVSLLPSATEIVYLLGLGEDLVGVTHECDWPPEAAAKQQVTHSKLPPGATPSEIDRLVNESQNGGAATHGLDDQAIRDLAPDLLLTQDLCAVCATPAGHVRAALDHLGVDAEVISLDPSSLDDVLSNIVTVGKATGKDERAAEAVDALRNRLDHVGKAVSGRERPRTFALEWGDPPYNAGHWVPEMIEVAGGEPLLAAKGLPSSRITWDDVAVSDPEAVVFMPCGNDLQAACALAGPLLDRPEMARARAFYAAGANGYFSRPGPRLVDGVEALASVLHEVAGIRATPGAIARLR